MAWKVKIRALAAAVEGINAVTHVAPAPVSPRPSPPCLPRRRITDTVVRAMRSSQLVFVLASPASPPSSPMLRPPMHVAGKRFMFMARRGARSFYGSWVEFLAVTATTAIGPAVGAEIALMTTHFPKPDDVWINIEDTSSKDSLSP
uniref:Uncharacterized protein n=1 Tax=Leersia perrieri TaxID=77586 RepID=A0A0D9XHY6_9ORYZ